jgi:hypothetical protein
MKSSLRRHGLAWLFSALMIACLLSHALPPVIGADDASSSVKSADSDLGLAFNATLDAERASANVSGLIASLNAAGGLLDEAEVALAEGNSSGAASMADQCIVIAESVQSEAGTLKASASAQARTTFWTYLTFSVVSSAAFTVALLLVWRRFKRGYLRKMLSMKPTVTANEA